MFAKADTPARLAALLLFALAGLQASAQGSLKAFSARLSESRVSFSYSYSLKGGRLPLSGSGSVLAQDACFALEGDGLKTVSDGKSVWSLDEQAKELVIESLGEGAFSASPALILLNLERTFRQLSTRKSAFAAQSCEELVLRPSGEEPLTVAGAAVRSLRLYLTAGGGKLLGARISLEDGSELTVNVKAMKFLPRGSDLSPFRLDASALGSAYVITDLR